MAKNNAVWGIDIGQCALKALRCTLGDDGAIVADKYDFIEYPKILSQPEADPEELVREALREFLSRNEVKGDKVAISVSGQAGLSRFFKPPPVEAKTLPDIVKYEVKQQIPFPIEDVIWDWQQLGGTIVDGRTLDAEVGLFAMKREAVFRALRPFDEIDVEVSLVQLSPLSIFNVLCHDIIEDLPSAEEFDPEDPPESMVVMSMGTDTTDLIVSNGIKLWLRNIPIGGNHFTKQLSRELKLTQAKAEHLKRNARQAENPKTVFKAMRPVFNDLVNEVQRSLTFFASMDKTAEITKIVLLGNAAKLPGLRQYLNKQLELDIAKVSEFEKIQGDEVLSQKTFSENVLSYATAYGLCIQGLNKGQVKTNLLPSEIVTERIIRAKKPWVLVSVGLLMLGCLLGYFYKESAWRYVSKDNVIDGVSWDSAAKKADAVSTQSVNHIEKDQQMKSFLDRINLLNKEVTSSEDGKSTWIEIKSAIYQALPKDQEMIDFLLKEQGVTKIEDLEEPSISPQAYPYEKRKELFIKHLETKYYPNLANWFLKVEPIYKNQFAKYEFTGIDPAKVTGGAPKLKYGERPKQNTGGGVSATAGSPLDQKSGWVIELKGYHFQNSFDMRAKLKAAEVYVVENFIRRLENDVVSFPSIPGVDDSVSGAGDYKFQDFGIFYPTIVRETRPRDFKIVFTAEKNPNTPDEVEDKGSDDESKDDDKSSETKEDKTKTETTFEVNRYDFTIQMAWIPRTPTERFEARKARLEAKAAADKAAGGANGENAAGNQPNNTSTNGGN